MRKLLAIAALAALSATLSGCWWGRLPVAAAVPVAVALAAAMATVRTARSWSRDMSRRADANRRTA